MRASWALALAALACVVDAQPVYYDSTRWDPGSRAAGDGTGNWGETGVVGTLFHSLCARATERAAAVPWNRARVAWETQHQCIQVH